MKIDELTIGQARELVAIFGGTHPAAAGTSCQSHPMIGKHCVVRTYTDGVHIGTVSHVDGTECLLTNARRVWRWSGAFTLAEVATIGIEPDSKLSMEVAEVYVTQAISFTPTTEKARKSFKVCHE